jgi:hypothetical protein
VKEIEGVPEEYDNLLVIGSGYTIPKYDTFPSKKRAEARRSL